jgi:hypothetical protein
MCSFATSLLESLSNVPNAAVLRKKGASVKADEAVWQGYPSRLGHESIASPGYFQQAAGSDRLPRVTSMLHNREFSCPAESAHSLSVHSDESDSAN